MDRTPQTRFAVIVLGLVTLAAAALAVFNFVQEGRFQTPTDGVWWVEASGQSSGPLVADRVPVNSPGERAGIKQGDLLLTVNQQKIQRVADLVRELFHTKVYGSANYVISRYGIRIDVPVILEASDRSINPGLRLIALVYLGIGLYVLFRRWTAPHSLHFYVFCLTSFVMYSFLYTGKFNLLDQVIYWGYIGAGALQPALFLHFAQSFAERTERSETKVARNRNTRVLIALTYLPACAVVGLQVYAMYAWSATGLLAHRLEQTALAYLDFYYVLAAVLLYRHYLQAQVPLRRQQLKWLTRGTAVAVAPFTLFYVIPFLTDIAVPDMVRNFSLILLVVLPLTFSWAIIRYRLMDVDLIFKRGVTYTLATASLLGLYFLLVAVAASLVHARLPSAGVYGLIATIIITSALFDPIKRTIQERVDRVFDRKRYDYRQTLVEFGRGLSTQTDLGDLLNAIVERLPQTLLVARVAVFLPVEGSEKYRLAAVHGLPPALFDGTLPSSLITPLDLGFFDRLLSEVEPGAGSHIFLENPQHAPHLPDAERRAAATLDLNYYLPCRIKDRTVAVIGLGRTIGGDFLSSEDVELLESLASYIGIAIQNAQLYHSLQEKIAEFERLKEFNENIVESTNVGILAVDLEDRIESWNAQMEVLFALPRGEALGQRLNDVFSPAFLAEYSRVRDEPGVHHLYKFRLATRNSDATHTANVSIAPLVARDFKTVGRILLVDDITDRTELESQLAQAEKLSSIGLLAAGVAHEVNTPLAVISSYAQMLTKQVKANGEGERLAPLLDKITQQTFRASEIVNGLLNFSRTSGAEFRDTDLNAIIRDTLTLLEHQFKTTQVELVASLHPELPAIHGNAGKLQQVFLNLFLNAKDAMGQGGVLRVTTFYESSLDGGVTVLIEDSGSGIAPEHVRRIYDPFFTTKSAVREGERRGTGLGLAVTYGILQEHAGKIHVESKVGQGTTFSLQFPLSRKPVHV